MYMNALFKFVKNKMCTFFNVIIFSIKSFVLTLLNIAPEIVGEKEYGSLNLAGGKRKGDDADIGFDSFVEPTFSHLQNNRKILLFSERKHTTVRDLYLDDNHVNGLICGVAAFVGRKGIRKVAVLPSIFCTILERNLNADPVIYMEVYKDSYDILLAPIATGGHWYLAAFFIDTKMVVVLDSLHYPVPAIFWSLKSSVESILHLQFTIVTGANHPILLSAASPPLPKEASLIMSGKMP